MPNDSRRGKSPRVTPEEQQHDPTDPRGIFHQVIDWSPVVIVGNTIPPRDPDENEEDEDKEEEDRAGEQPVAREPDEDESAWRFFDWRGRRGSNAPCIGRQDGFTPAKAWSWHTRLSRKAPL